MVYSKQKDYRERILDVKSFCILSPLVKKL